MSHFAVACQAYQSSPVASLPETADVQDAYFLLQSRKISSLAIENDQGSLVGVVSLTDLLELGSSQAGSRPDADLLTFPRRPLAEVMTREVVTVSPDESLHEVARKMLKHRVHRVYVVADGRTLAVVSTRDLMMAVRDQQDARPISEFMSESVFSIRAEEPLSTAVERLGKAHVSGLVVVQDGHPVGIFTRREALASQNLPRSSPVEKSMNPALLVLAPETPLHRAAAQAAEAQVRRVVVQTGAEVAGILTGLDFARAVAN